MLRPSGETPIATTSAPTSRNNSVSGEQEGTGSWDAGVSRTRRQQGRDVRAGFTRVHADEHMGGAVFALEIRAERPPGGIECGVVQRRCARNAANPIGSKKLFRHR